VTDGFPSMSSWRVYAPHGLSDVFNLVVRPNPVLAPARGLPGQGRTLAAPVARPHCPALARGGVNPQSRSDRVSGSR